MRTIKYGTDDLLKAFHSTTANILLDKQNGIL
jgi:hypothetical protein